MQSGQEVIFLHLDDIIPNRFQPREVFDEKALKELAASIKEHGVIQPIIVRQVNNKYEIIAGERRYKASALAGMTKIPAIINNLDDKEAAKVALLENLQRKNLNPIEEARTYQKILELDQSTQESLAKTMGKSQSAVANKLRLLSLPDEVQDALLKENISERHARTLLNVKDLQQQKQLLNRIITEKMTVKALEEEIKKINPSNDKTQITKENEIMPTNNIVNNNSQLIPPNINASIDSPSITLPSNEPSSNMTLESIPQNFNTKPNLMEANEDPIVNYGEVNNDDTEEIDSNIPDYNIGTSSAGSQIDINQIKSKTMDVNDILMTNKRLNNNTLEQNNKISNDLDNLFNITQDKVSNQNVSVPTLDMINADIEPSNNDYFKNSDLQNVNIPNSATNSNAVIKNFKDPIPKDNNQEKEQSQPQNSINNLTNTLFQQPANNPKPEPSPQKSLGMALIEETYNIPQKARIKQYNINQIVNQIRNVVDFIEKSGAKIDTDEMDFENQYQIVIRIDKDSIK